MDLVSLRYFAEVVRQRSVSKAALSLGVVQPALTRRIQLLEQELGTSLLLRHRRGVEPTETGVLVFDRAELLLRMVQQIETEVRSQSAEPVGQIRFGFPPSVGMLLVGRIMAEYMTRYPRVTFYLAEDFSGGLRDSLLAGHVDLTVMSYSAGHPDLEMEPLFEEDLWVIGRASDWPFGNAERVQPEALRDHPLLLASFLNISLARLSTERNIPFRVIVEADSLTALKEATLAGAGLFITPRSSIEREVDAGVFAGAAVDGLTVTRGLFRRRNTPQTRAAQTLTEMIHVEVARLCADFPERFWLPSRPGATRPPSDLIADGTEANATVTPAKRARRATSPGAKSPASAPKRPAAALDMCGKD